LLAILLGPGLWFHPPLLSNCQTPLSEDSGTLIEIVLFLPDPPPVILIPPIFGLIPP
jgi:hypothetical protein